MGVLLIILMVIFACAGFSCLNKMSKGEYKKTVKPITQVVAMLCIIAMFGILLYAFFNWI